MYLVPSIHTGVSRICFQKSPHCPCSMHNYAFYSFLPVCSILYNSFSIPFKIDIQDGTQKGIENNVANGPLIEIFHANQAVRRTQFLHSCQTRIHQHTYRLIKYFSTPPIHYAPLNFGCLCDHTRISGSSVSYFPSAQPMCYTGLFISPSGISELDCATTKIDTAERSISIGRESLQVFFVLGASAYFQVPPLGGSRDEKWRSQ